MNNNRVDYDKIAANYDKTRRGGGPYLETMVNLARGCSARTVLEIGAGTGNNTQAFLNEYPCRLVGVDLSKQMLARAKAKDIPAGLVRASALELPLPGASVDFVFGVYVLHHIPETDRLLGECARVMAKGAVAFVTASHDFIDGHIMNRYFPSFAAIDKARFQTIECLELAFLNAGFASFEHAAFSGPSQKIDLAYVEKVEQKALSTCELLPEDEYARGLARLRADVNEHEVVGTTQWESVLVWGKK
jgi:ubiquinone/menaquinone biosynthesis C-methylase UbiE